MYSGLLLRTYVQDLRTGTRTMPPLRRRSRVQDTNVGAEAALLNDYSVQQLRNLCRQKKIASTGNKATLLNRLRGSGPRVTVSNADTRGRLQETNEMSAWFGTCSPPRPCGQHQRERFHLLGRTIKYNSTTGSGVYRCCLEGNRQRSRSGRRSGFTAKFLANSFKFQWRHASH